MTIEGNIAEVRGKIKQLKEAQSEAQRALEYLNTHKKQYAALRKQIHHLSLIDQKTLVESMLDNKPIRVIYIPFKEDHPEDGEGISLDYKLHFNPEIIKRFLDEGRLKGIKSDINSSDNYSASNPRRSPRNHQNSFCGW